MAAPRKRSLAPQDASSTLALPSQDVSAESALDRTRSPAPPMWPPHNIKHRKRRRLNYITQPQPGSLYDILHDNRGEALFVVPAYWQDQHAQLLGVRWIHHFTVQRPSPHLNSMSSKYHSRPSNFAKALSGDLTTILTSEQSPNQSKALRSAMSTMFPDILSQARCEIDLDVRFGDQVVKKGVRVALLWKLNNENRGYLDSASTTFTLSHGGAPTSGGRINGSQGRHSTRSWSDRPVLAFVNRTYLQQKRSELYRVTPGPNHSPNVPIENLQRIRRKRLIPHNAAQDSYLVAVMLAIAQWQCYRRRSTQPPKTSSQDPPMTSHAARNASLPQAEFRDVPVKIMTQDHENAEFIIYSTVVTTVFLKRFAFPMKAPVVTGVQGGELNIDVTPVKIWPVLGLKERLAQALCPEIGGDSAWDDTACTDLETWETKQELALHLSNLKRRRKAFSTVRPGQAPYPHHTPKRMLRIRDTSNIRRYEPTRIVRRSARIAARQSP